MEKNNFSYGLAAVLFTLLLSGCVSVAASPNPHFYMPEAIAKKQLSQKFDIASGVIIAVGPVGIPGYQDRPQIVTRNKDGTINFAQFDRWAEPLDSGLARLISDDLATMLPAASFQLFPCNFAIPLDYQVIVDILQLDSQLDKSIVMTAQWSIIDSKNRKLLLTRKNQFSQAINPHNYSGLSKALGEVSVFLSKEIAEDLANLSRQPKPVKESAAK